MPLQTDKAAQRLTERAETGFRFNTHTINDARASLMSKPAGQFVNPLAVMSPPAAVTTDKTVLLVKRRPAVQSLYLCAATSGLE